MLVSMILVSSVFILIGFPNTIILAVILWFILSQRLQWFYTFQGCWLFDLLFAECIKSYKKLFLLLYMQCAGFHSDCWKIVKISKMDFWWELQQPGIIRWVSICISKELIIKRHKCKSDEKELFLKFLFIFIS